MRIVVLRFRSLQSSPRLLELTAADELLAIENMDVLRKNGFEIQVDDLPESCGHRLRLVAQPVSKATVFDIKGKAP